MKFQTYLIIVLTVAFFAVVGFGAYFVMMQSRLMNEMQNKPPVVITSPETINEPTDDSMAGANTLTAASPVPTTQPSPTTIAQPTKEAQVIFTASDTFSTPEKTQIKIHITDPYLLYHQDFKGSGNLLTLTISRNPNVQSKGEFPYSADGVFDSGVKEGFLIQVDGGTVDSGGQVQWWVPECLMQCQFSDAFKTAYPEIVAAAGG